MSLRVERRVHLLLRSNDDEQNWRFRIESSYFSSYSELSDIPLTYQKYVVFSARASAVQKKVKKSDAVSRLRIQGIT